MRKRLDKTKNLWSEILAACPVAAGDFRATKLHLSVANVCPSAQRNKLGDVQRSEDGTCRPREAV
jgi:hypothetical protein